jgi:hypothetical protein
MLCHWGISSILTLSGSGFGGSGLTGIKQVIKQFPIVGHCSPLVFGSDFTASITLSNIVGSPVALH